MFNDVSILGVVMFFAAVTLGAVLVLVGGGLGAYVVFRTKHAQMDIPFTSPISGNTHEGIRFVDEDDSEEDESLSDAALRVREQGGISGLLKAMKGAA